MTTTRHCLLFLLLGFLHNAVGVSVPSSGSAWHRRISSLAMSQTPLRQRRGASVCNNVTSCLENNRNAQLLDSVMTRFDLGELSASLGSLCGSGSGSPVESCWRDGCRRVILRMQLEFNNRVLTEICDNQDSFRSASGCFPGSLGSRFDACGRQAFQQLSQDIAKFDPVVYANYFTMCGHDVIDSLPPPCRQENKTFLKEFFSFVIMSNLDMMTPR